MTHPSSKQQNQKRPELELLNLNAAGLAIGAEEIYACVPRPGGSRRDELPVRKFGAYTVDLHSLAAPIGHPPVASRW